MKNNGVNWAKELENYQQVMNDSAREELAWKTPFQVYYGRQSNRLTLEHSTENKDGNVSFRDHPQKN